MKRGLCVFWTLVLSFACAMVQMHCRSCNSVSLCKHLPCSTECNGTDDQDANAGASKFDHDHRDCARYVPTTAIGARSQQQTCADANHEACVPALDMAVAARTQVRHLAVVTTHALTADPPDAQIPLRI